MKHLQKWEGAYLSETPLRFFPATVPGNIQKDYADSLGWGNVDYGDNCLAYKPLEDGAWLYRTHVNAPRKDGERVWFVTEGIEYEYELRMNGKTLLCHTGMFSRVEYDVTDELENGDLLEIYVHPHPKRAGAPENRREQADQSCKPAVEYGWDWHPRLLVSGLWNDTYVETRGADAVVSVEPSYTLSDGLSSASIHFDVKCGGSYTVELRDPDGKLVYCGSDADIELDNVRLWWCNGQGEPCLYSWRVFSETDEKCGKIGFRKVALVMNEGAWDFPAGYPKSRSNPPITIELNGRRIFAKGSNWVNPEIFTGTITPDTYAPQIKAAAEAHMNIFRCWGGAIINKESFFELCDEYGIMVWQEFPLACNNYVGTPEYLAVLEQEATAIIRRLRRHACLVLWCGGNELFNGWSKMTDQSKALRLLNKLTYELDVNTPFIPTSPVAGMGHGHYMFRDDRSGKYVFEMFNKSDCTAYTEFGVPSILDIERIKRIMPEKDVYDPKPEGVWKLKNGFEAWGTPRWTCFNTYDGIFGKQNSLEDYIEKSIRTQLVGYKYIFEEARRQWPACSMAINWCYNEPWTNVAGNNLLLYGGEKKACYYSVSDALRPVMPSARFDTYAYKAGGIFSAELWLLNDSDATVSDTVRAYIEVNGERRHVVDWNTGDVSARSNKRGHKIQVELPVDNPTGEFTLVLEAACGVSRYTLMSVLKKRAPILMNDPLN